MSSELLSGGLPMHLYAYFSIPQLEAIEKDANEGIGNEQIIEMINEAKAKVKNKDDYLTEKEKFLHEIIHLERNESIDIVCEAL